jgi:tetratricopeptide (TPR) repeat protein
MALSVDAQISNMGDTTHVEFSGLSQWDYDIQKKVAKSQTIVDLIVPPLSAAAMEQLSSFRSADVKNIVINQKGPDGKVIVTLTMAGNSVDAFDYLTDQPSRLVIDIFKQKGSVGAAANAESTHEGDKPEREKTSKAAAKSSSGNRMPATTDILKLNPMPDSELEAGIEPGKRSGIFDGADPQFSRFNVQDFEVKEEAVIASRENVYLAFPTLRTPLSDLAQLSITKPIYEIIPKDTDENKQARLLLTLYNNKRYNVFLKTAEWFAQKFPHSDYDELVRFMWADAHFYLWLDKKNPNDFDLAMLRYRQALEKYPQTPLVERTLLLMGYATLERGDYLGTLRSFQSHIRARPQSPNRDRARLGVAEAYLKINRFEEALQQYREFEKDAASEKAKIEAAYLAGDVLFQKKDFQAAIAEYQGAQKKYPQNVGEFPNALFNQGAALFNLKDYRKSLDVYGDFLKKFPSHEYAGYAMTRVGELLDILGVDKARVVGAFLETYFRYGDAPSAIVARLRLLSSRMKGMKPKEVEKAVEEIGELAKKSELHDVEQFATVMIAEGYSKRQEYNKAINLLVKFYQAHPTGVDTRLLAERIVRNINDSITDLVDSGNFIEALKVHNQYADNWLKSSQRLDTKFNVARAFEQAGVFGQAEELYKDTLNKIYALKGTAAGKEKAVIEKLPTEDRMNLRLSASNFHQGKLNQAYDYLKNVKNPELLTEGEQVERVQLAAFLLDKKGDTASAKRYLVDLIKAWKGRPELVSEPYYNLAEIEIRQGKADEAIQSLRKVDELMEDSKKVSEDTHAKALEKLGMLQLEQGQPDAASATFTKLLDAYETKRPLASIRYKLGQIQFQKGDLQKASTIWKEIKGKENDFWAKLSQEQLKNSDWQDGYKKYIKRIPAMSEKGKQ